MKFQTQKNTENQALEYHVIDAWTLNEVQLSHTFKLCVQTPTSKDPMALNLSQVQKV